MIECYEEVTRAGELQPCNKPAAALRYDPEDVRPYPVCPYHTRGEVVGLDDVPAALTELRLPSPGGYQGRHRA